MDFDFGASAVVDTLDKVPEQFRPLYEQNAESKKFGLRQDPTVKGAVEAIVGLGKALKAERGVKRVDLSPLKDFGDNPETIAATVRQQLEELKGQVQGGEKAKLNIDKIKQDLASAHSKDLEGKDKRINALLGQLTSLMVDSTARSAIKAEDGDDELLLPWVRTLVKSVEEDGQFKVFVVDPQGDRRYSGVTGQPMTIAELVKEMKGNPKYGKLFASQVRPGSGARPGESHGRVLQPVNRDKSAMEKIQAGLAARSR